MQSTVRQADNSSRDDQRRTKRLLALSSSGGHWEQLMIIKDAFSAFDVSYATTMEGLGNKSNIKNCKIISDCNRNSIKSIFLCIKNVRTLMKITKPEIVITTGALPGLIALVFGKFSGAYCIWIDSVANAEKLSMSGKVASVFCDMCIVQWRHVAEASGGKVKFLGSVL